ncbi:Glutamyl-tRNA synthetase @ Glutamyl-tRNA(Gln) synthetase [hydrothermal vent metagenome]|uniref:glutamate--tRNA ligase n=1 Tax=hydrothermal vent metagenome TaxID=652676 RepID=A0A3B1C3E4_9ZZZZ
MAKTRVRFAPSPTGVLHVGTARTALYNYLFAKKTGGKFILRIEDTDKERSTADSETKLIESLKRLEIRWDEGPDIGGKFGPYRQSEKFDRYRKVTNDLVEAGAAYPCYCALEELEAERKALQAANKPPRYSGKCRSLSDSERELKEKTGAKPAYRFKVTGREVTFKDGVRGEVSFKTKDIGDFIITRPDGSAAYYLASSVDDIDMEITDVIRGEDHLSNTPKQILIMRAMGAEPPRFCHLPIILGADGHKLSKRSGAADVTSLLDAGYLPSALNTAMAMLGWSKVTGNRAEPLESMARIFDITDVSRSPARYDEARLDNINQKALKALPVKKLIEALKPSLEAIKFPFDNFDEESLFKIVDATRDAMGKPQDAADQMIQFARLSVPEGVAKEIVDSPEFKIVANALLARLEENNSVGENEYKAVIESVSSKTGLKGRKLFQPLRVAVTGDVSGPKLADLFIILGPEEIKKRLENWSGK